MWLDPKDAILLVDREDIIQSLSGEDFNESEDDLLSDEMQGSETNIHHLGLIKCSNSSDQMNKMGLDVLAKMELEGLIEIQKD
jgi:hypothetical protein